MIFYARSLVPKWAQVISKGSDSHSNYLGFYLISYNYVFLQVGHS